MSEEARSGKIEELETKFNQLEKKVEKLEKEKTKIKQENKKLKKEIGIRDSEAGEKQEEVSRRDFLKKLGTGALGIGVLSLNPASALNVKTDDFEVFAGSDKSSLTEYLSIGENGPFKIQNTSLQLPTGQSIEDEGGTNRFTITSNESRILNPDGEALFRANNTAIKLHPTADADLRVDDQEGNFTAYQYNTSPSTPGILELTNTKLDLKGNGIYSVGSLETKGANINGDHVWSSNFGGSTPDERLQNALSLVDNGTVVYLENNTYDQDLTITKEVKLVGTEIPSNGSAINGATWTAEEDVTFKYLELQGADLVLNGGSSEGGESYYGRVIGCYVNNPNQEDPVNIEINCSRAIISRIEGSGANIIFRSGTSQGVIDKIAGDITITDNGNNTLGTY